MRMVLVVAAGLAVAGCQPADVTKAGKAGGEPPAVETAADAPPPSAWTKFTLPAIDPRKADLGADRARIEACLTAAQTAMVSGDVCQGAVSEPCLDVPEGQSTAGMVACVTRETAVWDALLQDAKAKLSATPVVTMGAELKTAMAAADAAFEANKQAQCDLAYPAFDGGTMAQPIAANCVNELTAWQFMHIRSITATN